MLERRNYNSTRLPQDFILDALSTDLRLSARISNAFQTDFFRLSYLRVSMGITVNRQMAKKLPVNRQKRNIFTVNRQMREPKLADKFLRYA